MFIKIMVLITLLLLTDQKLLTTENNNELTETLIDIFNNLKTKKYQQSTTEIIIRNRNDNVDKFLTEFHKIEGSKVVIYDIENQTTCTTIEVNITYFKWETPEHIF